MAIFKLQPDTLAQFAEFIQTWKDSPDQHRANIVWAFAPSDYTEPGNDEFGGIQGSYFPGWGAQGGLRAKVVQCDKIDPLFIRPLGPNGDYFFGPDEFADINATDTSRTIQELAYLEWERLCGIPIGGANSDCEIDADLPMASGETQSTEQPPFAILALDEQCSYGPDFIAASTQCGGDLDYAFGDDSTARELERVTNEGIAACGKTFCQSLAYAPNQGNVGVDDNGFLFCWEGTDLAAGYRAPTQCDEGNNYMEAMRSYTQCTIGVSRSVSEQRRTASIDAESAGAGASLEACGTVIECDAKTLESITPEWGTRFCVNFFKALTHPVNDPDGEFAWVAECGFSGSGEEGSPLYDNCEALGFGTLVEDVSGGSNLQSSEGDSDGDSDVDSDGDTEGSDGGSDEAASEGGSDAAKQSGASTSSLQSESSFLVALVGLVLYAA
eukprot:Sro328_g118710.2  (441) ;mRNA; r:58820-60142